MLDCLFRTELTIRTMLFSREYVGYLAREITKKLISGEFIETKDVPAITEKVNAALLDELSLEDRINDEVRVILEAYSDEMQRSGANYQEMFRKVKSEIQSRPVGARNSFSGAIEGRPILAYNFSNRGLSCCRASSVMARSGRSG